MTRVSTDHEPSFGLALFAGAFPLLAVPLGFVVFARDAAHNARWASGALGGANEAWNAGGSGMFLCLAAAVLASLASSVGTYFAARGAVAGSIAEPAGAFFTFAGGVATYHQAMASMLDAITHASPSDQGLIATASVVEATWLVIFPLFLVAALFVTSGAGLLIGTLARRPQADPLTRRTLAVLGVGALMLGAWSLTMARSSLMMGRAWGHLVHSAADERVALLLSSLQHRAVALRLERLAMLGLLLVAIAGAFVLRASARHLAGGLAFVLISVVGLGGLRATTRPSDHVLELIAEGVHTEPLIDLDAAAISASTYEGIVLDTDLTHNGAPVIGLGVLLAQFSGTEVGLGLGTHATAEGLERVMRHAQAAGVKQVMLIGVHSELIPEGLEVPPPLRDAFTQYRAVHIGLADEETLCPDGCAWSTLSAAGLVTPSGTWPLVDRSGPYSSSEATSVLLRWERFEPELLIQGAHTAAGHDAQLTLVLPRAPEADPGLGSGDTREDIRSVVNAHRRQIRLCYERALTRNPRLEGKVVLELVIAPIGSVSSATVAETTIDDEELGTCITERAKTWRFPKPSGGVVVVRYPFVFRNVK